MNKCETLAIAPCVIPERIFFNFKNKSLQRQLLRTLSTYQKDEKKTERKRKKKQTEERYKKERKKKILPRKRKRFTDSWQ